jgi:hypothetical protein
MVVVVLYIEVYVDRQVLGHDGDEFPAIQPAGHAFVAIETGEVGIGHIPDAAPNLGARWGASRAPGKPPVTFLPHCTQ